jgi:hypothetical protein
LQDFHLSAPLRMCFAFYGTCVPFQHCCLHEQQWQDFHLQLLLGYGCIMWCMCSNSTRLLAVITLKYYTYVRRCWSFPEIFFLVGLSAIFMSFLPCFSPSKQNWETALSFKLVQQRCT